MEEPTSEAPRALASEQDQSIGLPVDREEPTSRPETESEKLEEVSEPAPPDHRNQEIQLPASHLLDSAWEKLMSQDPALLTDLVQASIVTENSSGMAQVESY